MGVVRSAVGGGDGVGDQGDVAAVEVSQAVAEADADAAGEAGGDPQDRLLRPRAGQVPRFQGVDGGVPPDHSERLPGGDAAAGGDDAPEGRVVREVAVPADQVDGRHVGAQPPGCVAQQAGQQVSGDGPGACRHCSSSSWLPASWLPASWLPALPSSLALSSRADRCSCPPRAAGGGSSSGGALGWACRPITCGTAIPALRPCQYTSIRVMSNGSKTSSTFRPARNGSTE